MATFKKASLPENMSLDIADQKDFHKKVKEIEKDPAASQGPGVIFLKHIPQGFFEPQMKAYFRQFGRVKRLRLSRSKKTGNIKGYGYIEFADDAVARIVASTMNNYLMFHRLLKCDYVPTEKLHEDTFKGCDRKFSKPKAHALNRQRHNTVKTPDQLAKAQLRAKGRQKKGLAKLAAMGVDYELPGMVTKEDVQSYASKHPEDKKPEVDTLKPQSQRAAAKRSTAKSAQKGDSKKRRKVEEVKEAESPSEEKEEEEEEAAEEGEDDSSEDNALAFDEDSNEENDDDEDDFDFDAMFGTAQSGSKAKQGGKVEGKVTKGLAPAASKQKDTPSKSPGKPSPRVTRAGRKRSMVS